MSSASPPSSADAPETLQLVVDPGTNIHQARIVAEDDVMMVTVDGATVCVTVLERGTPMLLLVDGRPIEVMAKDGSARGGGLSGSLSALGAEASVLAQRATPGIRDVISPMPGRVVKVHCEAGAHVLGGQPLLVLEAMKMENELVAPGAGVVEQVLVAQGDAIEAGIILLRLRSPETAANGSMAPDG